MCIRDSLSYITFGRLGFSLVQASLLITQTGFCCSYVIYIVECVDGIFPGPKNLVAVLTVGAVLPMVLLRHLKYLTNSSLMANIMNCSAFAVVYVFSGQSLMDSGVPEDLEVLRGAGFLHFVGIAVYCYEGIGLVLPLEASMEDRSEFGWVLRSSMIAVTVLFLSFGASGYIAYGEETNSLITDNLPTGLVSQSLRVVLAVGLFFTYPIMMFPVSQILDDLCLDMSDPQHPPTLKQNMLRVCLVAVTALVARSVPDFGLFISLVGSSCCALLAFVMPAAIHLEVHRDQMQWYYGVRDLLVMLFGVVVAVLGTYISLQEIVNALHEPELQPP
eukprot:TRINITY_DN2779_c0_g1_i3.p1 TRINITY_DN2779_c0_g1~~TRINITY_DN2779_c0_g1_i3.p1  ORF type:complete len:331 (-),score=111.06 TRINITY_DN2779_c0_g1_i3:216-1208(-)